MLDSSENQKRHPRQPFTQDEDAQLTQYVNSYSQKEINWAEISFKMKNRNIRQCKERWEKYLNPNLSVEPWTQEEDDIITNMHLEFGPKWTLIANILGSRTDIMVKNRWNVLYRKALKSRKLKNKEKNDENPKKHVRSKKKEIPKIEIKQRKNKNSDNTIIQTDSADNKNDVESDDLASNSWDRFDIFDQIIRTNDYIDYDMFL